MLTLFYGWQQQRFSSPLKIFSTGFTLRRVAVGRSKVAVLRMCSFVALVWPTWHDLMDALVLITAPGSFHCPLPLFTNDILTARSSQSCFTATRSNSDLQASGEVFPKYLEFHHISCKLTQFSSQTFLQEKYFQSDSFSINFPMHSDRKLLQAPLFYDFWSWQIIYAKSNLKLWYSNERF